MKTLVNFLLCLVCLGLPSAVWAQQCEISNFESRDIGSLSAREYFSYVLHMSDSEWRQRGSNVAGQGLIHGVPVGASYSDAQRLARERLQRTEFTRDTASQTTWARSVLNEEGLKAYLGCLGSLNRGLNLGFTIQGPQTATLIVNWNPRAGQSMPRPRVTGSNIANISEVRRVLSAGTWGPAPVDYELNVTKRDRHQPATITVSGGSISRPAFWPAVPRIDETHRLPIDQRACESGGGDDNRICTVINQLHSSRGSTDLSVTVSLPGLEFRRRPETSDPHRQGWIEVSCGNQSTREYAGQVNSPGYTVAYTKTVFCRGEPGQAVPVRLLITPRSGTDILVGGGSAVHIVETSR